MQPQAAEYSGYAGPFRCFLARNELVASPSGWFLRARIRHSQRVHTLSIDKKLLEEQVNTAVVVEVGLRTN
jgi:hypothetical protein